MMRSIPGNFNDFEVIKDMPQEAFYSLHGALFDKDIVDFFTIQERNRFVAYAWQTLNSEDFHEFLASMLQMIAFSALSIIIEELGIGLDDLE